MLTSAPTPTHTATVTGVLRGKRIYRTVPVAFVHAHDGEEDFAPAAEGRPAQSRIFVRQPRIIGNVPMLIVKGSLTPIGGA